jgi:hypothetical protein
LTSARILSTPGDGHGLTDRITDALYHALSNDQPAKPIVALVILDPVQHGGRKTAKGKHRFVSFEVTHLEPVLDANQANEVRWNIQSLYEARTTTGTQRPLPGLDATEKEKQLALMERIEDWAKQEGISGGDLDAKWRENFGIEPGAEWSFGDQGVPGDYRKASHAYLLQFAYDVGVLSTETPLPHEEREALDDEDDDASDEGAEPDTADSDEAEVGVKCQVCGKKSKALSDGLCRVCAKNAGVRHLGDDAEQAETA